MKNRVVLMGVAVLAVLCAVNLMAREKRVKRSDLPLVVRKVADAQSKGATVRGYTTETENGRLEYEVETNVGNHTRDVSIATDGSILEIEEQVDLDALPAAVREALRDKAAPGAITKIESITKGGKIVAYEAQVRTHGKHSEIQVGPDGKPLAHEE